MQYDYCAAYLELFKDEPKKARADRDARTCSTRSIGGGTPSRPSSHRSTRSKGRATKVVDGEDRGQKQGDLAATEPGFELTVNAQGVNLTWQNIEAVQVNYYLMDVELLFSTTRSCSSAGGQFATIKPNATEVVKLPTARNKHTFPLPAEFAGRNVLVEVTAARQDARRRTSPAR